MRRLKLMVVTQKVDSADRNLGFFVPWLKLLSRSAELVVIANEVGKHDLPSNVAIYSLGKEQKVSRLARWRKYRTFMKREVQTADGVFFHMCPEYVIGAYPFLKQKKSLLWYVHKSVSWRLRLALMLADGVFTASKESCRLQSPKIKVVGHGIDTELFKPGLSDSSHLHLVSVGRISPVKDLTTIVRGFRELQKNIPHAELSLIGEPITETDKLYAKEIRRLAHDGGVRVASVPFGNVFSSRSYTAFVHASQTGSLDKAPLEALAAGLPVFSSSEAFSEEMGVRKFKGGDPRDMAKKIESAYRRGELRINEKGRAYVAAHHSLPLLIQKIISWYAV